MEKIRIRDLGWKNSGPGSGMENFLIRDGKNLDPGWKKFGSGIRDKHPGSATLIQSDLDVLEPLRIWIGETQLPVY